MIELRQNTAVTVNIGPLLDWRDARTPLIDNVAFDATDLAARLIKGSTGTSLTLSKSGGDNNINLDGYGSATLTLTAANVDTCGSLQIVIINAVTEGISSDLIGPVAAAFSVLSPAEWDRKYAAAVQAVDLTAQAKADVNAQCDTAITDAALATAANLALVKDKTDLIPASPAAVGSIMALSSETIEAVQAGLGTISNQAAILSEIDNLQDISAADVVTALKAATGFTAGGTLTFARIVKVIAAWAAGKARLKPGSTNVIQILDAEDGTTVIMELTASESTPFKQVALT